jgi:hypothetical protein
MIANKVFEGSSNFGVPEWRRMNYDDINEDAQLLHQCMTKRLKHEDDPDYDPDLHIDGDSIRPPGGGQYFQKPIFQCPECVRSYKSPVRMANHYRDKHPEKDLRSPYARFPNSQRDKRHYDHSPPKSPDVDNLPYSPHYYTHKHTFRTEREREKFRANENTSQIINPYTRTSPPHRVPSSSTTSSPSYPLTPSTPTSTHSRSSSPSFSPSASPSVSPTTSPVHPSITSSSSPIITASNNTKNKEKFVKESDGKITVNGRTYECKGIKISTIVDENKFGKYR